jgi:hypothetical protein
MARHDQAMAGGGLGDDRIHFCIPLGYPAEGARFGGSRRRPTQEATYLDHWGAPVPWA